MKCPACGAPYRPPTLSCKRCKADLTELIQIHDHAIWYHRQAISHFVARDYFQAKTANDRAIALHSNHPDFHALAGKLLALLGHFPQASAAWQRTLQLQPTHPVAMGCLEWLNQARSMRQPMP